MKQGLPSSLPPVSEHGQQKLPVAVVRYWTVRAIALGGLILLLGYAAMMIWDKAWLQFGFRSVLCPLVVVAVVVDLVCLNRWQFKNYSYTVTPSFVYVARGRLFRQSMTLSAAQILNVEIRRGPILSWFDLAEVHFTMVVDSEPLGPVTWPEAIRVRDRVLGEPVDAVEERDDEG